jgi:hypothetical protein
MSALSAKCAQDASFICWCGVWKTCTARREEEEEGRKSVTTDIQRASLNLRACMATIQRHYDIKQTPARVNVSNTLARRKRNPR